MHECVLLNMFCSICLIAIIALRLLYVFKKKTRKMSRKKPKCQMLYASETGCYHYYYYYYYYYYCYYYYLQFIVLVSSGGKM